MSKKRKAVYSGIGGQAVLEGIMMRNGNKYSVVVQKSDKTMETVVKDVSVSPRKGVYKIPFVRGVFAFAESLKLGLETLEFSANFYGTDTSEPTWFDKFLNKLFGKHTEAIVTMLTMMVSTVVCIAVFLVLPFLVSLFLERRIANPSLISIIEGITRILIFILYAFIISLLKDTRRTFRYHGAEHKCINCIEHGKRLTVNNVRTSSRLHGRCGTNFIFIIGILTIVAFFFIKIDSVPIRILLRILMIPVISGVAYEILRIIGKYNNIFTNIIASPGLALQFITTKEPDEEMIQVAINAVEAVFDWKTFLIENFPEDYAPEDFGLETKNDNVKIAVKKKKQVKKKETVRDVFSPRKSENVDDTEETVNQITSSEKVKDDKKSVYAEDNRSREAEEFTAQEETTATEEVFAAEENTSKEDELSAEGNLTYSEVGESEKEILSEDMTQNEEVPKDIENASSEEALSDKKENGKVERINSAKKKKKSNKHKKLDSEPSNVDTPLSDEEQVVTSETTAVYDEVEIRTEEINDLNYAAEDLLDLSKAAKEAEVIKTGKTAPIKLDFNDDFGFSPDDEEVPVTTMRFEPIDEKTIEEYNRNNRTVKYEEEENDEDGPLFNKDIVSIPMPDEFKIVEVIPEGGVSSRIYNLKEDEQEGSFDEILDDDIDIDNIIDEDGHLTLSDTDAFNRKLDAEFDDIMKRLGLDDND